MDSRKTSSPKEHLTEQFAKLWEKEGTSAAPDVFAFLDQFPNIGPDARAEVIEVDQSVRWKKGLALPIEEYFKRCPDVAAYERRILMRDKWSWELQP